MSFEVLQVGRVRRGLKEEGRCCAGECHGLRVAYMAFQRIERLAEASGKHKVTDRQVFIDGRVHAILSQVVVHAHRADALIDSFERPCQSCIP